MYIDKLGFIESLTYTAPDNAPWEIGMNGGDSDYYKAPMIIEVELTFKFLLGRENVNESSLYDFGKCKPKATPPPPPPPPSIPTKKQNPVQTIPPNITTTKTIGTTPTKLTGIPNIIPAVPPPPPPPPPPPTPPPPVTGPPPPVPTPPPPPPTPPTSGGMLGGAPAPTPDVNIVVPPPPPPPPLPPPPPPPLPPPPPPDISQITGTDINTVKTIVVPKESTNIHLYFYDSAEIDGDRIDVYVDNQKIIDNETLYSQPITRIINHGRLKQSEYRVTMVALNQGSIGENTALLVVRPFKDGNEFGNARQEINMRSLVNASGNNKGVSASIIIKTQ
jgi:hypothetical protein